MPRVVHLTYSPSGGAGIASRTLSWAIEKHTNWRSEVLSFHPSNLLRNPLADPLASTTAAIDEFAIKEPGAKSPLSLVRKSNRLKSEHLSEIISADIVHLHWIEGLLHGDLISALAERDEGTVFLTLHDMRSLTGSCHFSGDCRGFTNDCVDCPIVRPAFRGLVSRSLANRQEIFESLKPVFIAPGKWMRGRFLESSISHFPCHIVPNALNESFFLGREKPKRRGALQLGFVAANLTDPRKGLGEAREQVWRLSNHELEVDFQLVGLNPPKNLSSGERHLGSLSEEQMPEWMASLDFLVFASLSDNAPLVVAESLATGTPVLLVKGTGADDMVSLGKDSLDLLEVTLDQLSSEQANRRLSNYARHEAVNQSPDRVAKKIVSLYESKG